MEGQQWYGVRDMMGVGTSSFCRGPDTKGLMILRNIVLEEPGDPDVKLWAKQGSYFVWDHYGGELPNNYTTVKRAC